MSKPWPELDTQIVSKEAATARDNQPSLFDCPEKRPAAMNPNMQRQYPGTYHQQIPQRSPHHSSSSRRSQVPMSGPHGSHAKQLPNQAEIQQREQLKHAVENEDKAKRRSEKPTDKNIPDGVETLIVGDGVQQYKRLREVERRLDAIMMRKKLDQQDSIQNPVKKYSTMRIWISNAVENQPWQGSQMDENAFDFTMGVEATYRVKIEGRLIEDEEGGDEGSDDGEEDDMPEGGMAVDEAQNGKDTAPKQAQRPSGPQQRTKLSHFFKAITVDFDRNKNLQPDGTSQVEWKKPPQAPNNAAPLPNSADFDCLEFERKSDENINCTINFYCDDERHLLSPELAAVLDTTEGDRASIIEGIWEYIKAMGIAQDDDKRMIQCDDRLKALFKRDTVFFPHIPTLIIPHLQELPPLSLPYTIRVDPDHHASPTPTIYTLRIPHTTPSTNFTPSLPQLKQLAAYDDHLALLIQALGAAQRKHSFLEGYSKDPVTFTKRWMASQKRDLEVVLGEGGRYEADLGWGLGGEWRRGGRGGVWGSEQVREGVGLMVAKAGRDGRPF